MARYANYVFDLYGTLVDIRTDEEKPSLWRAAAGFFRGNGAAYDAEELRASYLRLCRAEQAKKDDPHYEIELRHVFRMLYEKKGVKADEGLVGETAVFFRSRSTEKLEEYPWVRPVFSLIRSEGAGIYLLSNAQACFTLPELKKLGLLNEFDGMVLSSDAGVRKPDVRIMKKLLDSYGLSVGECLMTGNDQRADMGAAEAVSMDCLFIKTETSGRYDPKLRVSRELLDGDFSRLPGLMGL